MFLNSNWSDRNTGNNRMPRNRQWFAKGKCR